MNEGVIRLLVAELFFALGTVIVKIVTSESGINGVELAFFRFLTGFLIITAYVLITRTNIRPVKPFYVYMRAIFNTSAVIFFFLGVEYSNVSKGNLLNMTYPVFVMLLAPFINRERTSRAILIYLLIIMAGIYLIVIPEGSSSPLSDINRGDIFSLLSGVSAGFAISFLRESRKNDSVYTILFYLFGFGTLLSGFLCAKTFILPTGSLIFYIVILALLSFIGQMLLTSGYRFINAATGSLLSSSRIVFAMIFGIVLFSEPLTERIVIGALMIAITLAGINGFFGYIFMKVKR